MRRTMPRMRSERGVSEVIGTILILAMTVVLFASIIMWVSSIPTPQASIRLDMDGQLSPFYNNTGGWAGANFTVQHRGGETLDGFGTSVFFIVEHDDGSFDTESLRTRGSIGGVPYGIDGPDLDWNAGEVWKYTNYSVRSTDKVTLAVVDNPSSTVVWTEEVRGPVGTHPPVFVEKWLDGDTSTAITRDTPLTNQLFGLYARIEDPDGDLKVNNVSAKFTFGPHATYLLYDDATHGDRVANDTIFTLANPALQPKLNWDGGIIILKAEDLQAPAHVTESRLVFQVILNPKDPVETPTKKGPGDLFFSNEFQAYGIYNATAWDLESWGADETRTFKKDEWVVVVVASQFLRNIDLQNDFMLYNTKGVPQVPIVYSNAPYNRPFGATTVPSSTHAFTFLEELSGYSVYEYRFRTESDFYGHDGVQLDLGQYHFEITLRASNTPPPRNQFSTVDAMRVTDANGSAPDYPVVEFFKDAAHTKKASEFKFTDTVYVRVKVLDTDASVIAGDVTVSDFIGGVQIWARPGTTPVGTITTNGTRYYKFTVDLSQPNRDPWIFSRGSYGFRIKLLRDVNEIPGYTLSSQIVVNGPRWALDVVSAIEEFSHPVFSEKWYAIFNDNDRLWTTYLIEKYKGSPGSPDPPWGAGRFYQTVLSDLDEDGDLDVAVGIANGYVWWYRNTGGRGFTWEKFTVDIPANPVRSLAAGRIDQDTDNDLVAGMGTGQIYWYANDGVWTRTTVATLGAVVVNAIRIADTDMDGDRDIVAACSDSRIRIYQNSGTGTFPSSQTITLASAAVDVRVAEMENDTDNDIVVATGSNIRIYRGPGWGLFWTMSTTDPALSVDVGYIDGDALLDVVAGTNAGNLYWFRNMLGGAWTRTTIVTLGALDDIMTLRVGDVDGDGLDDVVIGSQAGWIRWYRHLTTGAWDTRVVLTITTNIQNIDLGDVDRGVIIDYARVGP